MGFKKQLQLQLQLQRKNNNAKKQIRSAHLLDIVVKRVLEVRHLLQGFPALNKRVGENGPVIIVSTIFSCSEKEHFR